ncbi:MAG: MBL fold metallo-hydrolase [Deltaproteobacteria bacterium]|nr:MBL fold metallo-hydrolase [Deltaproteobacteria bacterium]
MNDMIRFFGVRGSIATPGVETARVGGNTTCSLVSLAGESIILDAGTGLRALGTEQGMQPIKATILFSHLHWDHIQGIPFFGPLYNPKSELFLIGPQGLRQALEKQMSLPNFPVGMETMGAKIHFRTINAGDSFKIGKVKVETSALNHPGQAIGYRLEYDGKVLVHALDHEHGNEQADKRLLELARNADVFVYDAQYLPDEYESKKGWGHSTYEKGIEFAKAAQVKTLVLAHHDPSRADKDVIRIEQRARWLYPDCWVARESSTFDIGTNENKNSDREMLEKYLCKTLSLSI